MKGRKRGPGHPPGSKGRSRGERVGAAVKRKGSLIVERRARAPRAAVWLFCNCPDCLLLALTQAA